MQREIIHQSERVVVYPTVGSAGTRVDKAIPAAHADGRARQQLEHECRILSELDVQGVPRAHGLRATTEGLVLTLDRAPGDTLARTFETEPAPVLETLEIAVELATVLRRIRSAGFAHRHITPHNVVYDRESGRVSVVDLGLATRIRPDAAAQRRVDTPEGTLGFCAPEQTGRTDTSVDHRVDQFGLGATLYWLLCGVPPASAIGLLEIVHQTVAVVPPACSDRRSDVPLALSKVVGRLLAKAPDNRYFQMAGALADLERCRDQFRATGQIADFTPGGAEERSRFRLPERLYGRDAALATLEAAFKRAASGHPTLVTLAGDPGSGKTALAHGFLPAVARAHGFFASGKFGQVREPSPYSALVDALRRLLRQLLSRHAGEIELLRRRMHMELGGQAAVLAPMLPEIEQILGPQQGPKPLQPFETKGRFRSAIAALFKVLCAADYPVVFLLDDVQWSDRGSIELARDLLTTSGLAVMVILAYRTDELSAKHPARSVVETLPALSVVHLDVEPLTVQHVTELLADALRQPAFDVRGLARLVVAKTHGNAYFVREFLTALSLAGGIVFDQDAGKWSWSEDRIAELPMADNVVALLTNRLQTLPPRTREALSVAACIGGRFDLQLLAEGRGLPIAEVAEAILPAVDAGLLRPVGDALDALHRIALHQTPSDTDGIDAQGRLDCGLQFSHDQVQRAAVLLVSPKALPSVRLTLGRRLRQRNVATVEIVDQYNTALELVDDPVERRVIATLNLVAANEAAENGSFETAHRYYKAGVSLLPADISDANHGLAMELLFGQADAALMTAGHADHEQLIARLLRLAQTDAERVACLESRLRWHLSRYENAAAIDTVIEALAVCGVSMPRSASDASSLVAIVGTRFRMRKISAGDFEALAVANDEMVEWAMRLLVAAVTPAFYVDVKLIGIIMLKLVNLSLKHGLTKWSAYGLAGYAMILAAGFNKVTTARALSSAAGRVLDRFDAEELRARILTLEHGFLTWRAEPMSAALEPQGQIYRHAVEHGDAEYGAFAAHNQVMFAILAGRPLAGVKKLLDTALARLAHLDQRRNLVACQMLLQLVTNLEGDVAEPSSLDGEHSSREDYLTEVDLASDKAGRVTLTIYELMLCVGEGEYERALEHADAAETQLNALLGAPQLGLYHAFSAIARLVCARKRSGRAATKLIGKARKSAGVLTVWCRDGTSFAALLGVVQALLLEERGRMDEAVATFDRAIEKARSADNLHNAGLVLEIAAWAHIERGHMRAAVTYTHEAIAAWDQYGARGRVRRLAQNLGRIGSGWDVAATPRFSRLPAHTQVGPGELDKAAMLLAARTISGEIVLNELLKKLMTLITEVAGAGFAVLVINDDGRPRPAAIAHVAEGSAIVKLVDVSDTTAGQPEPIPARCRKVVDLVLRTGQPILMADASTEDTLVGDVDTAQGPARSVMCLPLTYGDERVGVCYLENQLLLGAFTRERLETVSVLCAQAAVSIANARLYKELETSLTRSQRLTEAYQRFVPEAFLTQLGQTSIEGVALGDQVERDMTVLFLDIRGFATLSEQLTPQKTFQLLNRMLRIVGPVVRQYGGFVDKFIGDGVMAIYPGPPNQAIKSALEMARAVRALDVRDLLSTPLEVGIGLHHGAVMLGAVGEAKRLDSTVISDAVNIAARLERLTRTYSATILVSESTLTRAKEAETQDTAPKYRTLGRVRVRGRTGQIVVVELLDPNHEPSHVDRYAAAPALAESIELEARGQRDAARRTLTQALEMWPEDGALRQRIIDLTDD